MGIKNFNSKFYLTWAKGAFTYDFRFFGGIFDLPTYNWLNWIKYGAGLIFIKLYLVKKIFVDHKITNELKITHCKKNVAYLAILIPSIHALHSEVVSARSSYCRWFSRRYIIAKQYWKQTSIDQKNINEAIKGQLISKANSKLFIWTKKPIKIFLYFCPSL